jgi:hypothetical protein
MAHRRIFHFDSFFGFGPHKLVVKLFVLVSLLFCEWLAEELRVLEELLISVSFCEWVESSWLFAPRL